MTPEQVISILAEFSATTASHAGVGACETAGGIVSALHANPELIEPFLADPVAVWHDNFDRMRWENGSLTWHGRDGRVVSPAQLRSVLGQHDH